MDITSVLTGVIKGDISEKIGQATGTDKSTVESVIAVGLPVILGQMANNTGDEKGAQALDAAVEKDHTSGSLLESLGGLFAGGDSNNDGGKIIEHVLGEKQSSANETIANKTGIDVATVAKILTFLAPLVMAYLGKKKSSDNLDAGGLSDLLKQQKTENGGLLSDLATAVLDKNKDGSMLDDVIGGLFGNRSR
ncbi:DUF937 domain-containing protein [Candidatus Saccharibacteria bacterium]|nr:DUF937 domain-containing protein [Candidatus Saccharibacteria bacterium]